MPTQRLLRTLIIAALLFGCGCASIRVTSPDRTATEQFLLSQAAARAVARLRVDLLRGRAVYIDPEYFAASEAEFVLGELRAHFLASGVKLVAREQAQVIVEVRSGGVGIDSEAFLLGLPSLGGRSGDEAVPASALELSILKNIAQRGVASVAYVAYWAETGEVVGVSGPYVGLAFRDDWWFFGLGPRTSGDISPVTDESDLLEELSEEEAKAEDAP